MSKLDTEVEQFVKHKNARRLLVALSGGVDSVSLLQSQFLHDSVTFFPAESVSSPQSQFLYYTVNFFIAESISLL